MNGIPFERPTKVFRRLLNNTMQYIGNEMAQNGNFKKINENRNKLHEFYKKKTTKLQ